MTEGKRQEMRETHSQRTTLYETCPECNRRIRYTPYKIRSTLPAVRCTFMQNKPNLLDAQMNISSVKTMNYEQITTNNANKNKPNL